MIRQGRHILILTKQNLNQKDGVQNAKRHFMTHSFVRDIVPYTKLTPIGQATVDQRTNRNPTRQILSKPRTLIIVLPLC